MPFYTSEDGTRLHYRLVGSGRPALLFIHGWCGNLGHWEPQARAFGRRHRVLRVDRRGDGRSEAPARGYGPREQADEIAALARSLRIRGAVAIGHAGGTPRPTTSCAWPSSRPPRRRRSAPSDRPRSDRRGPRGMVRRATTMVEAARSRLHSSTPA